MHHSLGDEWNSGKDSVNKDSESQKFILIEGKSGMWFGNPHNGKNNQNDKHRAH